MFEICRNRKVIIKKNKQTNKNIRRNLFPNADTELLWIYKEKATSLWIDSHLSTLTPQPHRGHKCGLEEQAAACQSHLAQLWAYFSVPCSLLHVESSVEQWCLQRTCFLILHLVIFFLYFCWFNICINCKYIWFITVKPLVPVSGLPPWLFLINTLDLGFESEVHAHVGKFSVLLSLHTCIWHGLLLCWDWSCQVLVDHQRLRIRTGTVSEWQL